MLSPGTPVCLVDRGAVLLVSASVATPPASARISAAPRATEPDRGADRGKTAF